MSKANSQRQLANKTVSHDWSAIIYGRSYYIDFRFIALPEDFSDREKSWASRHILATLDRANKLSTHPRWSIFKNQSHCVVGVTCMVRDLLVGMEQDIVDLLSKDNRGRPLYIFVGYVTKTDRRRQLLNFPAYADAYLQEFQNLYQYILQIWWKEEYEPDSKKPIYSKYEPLEFKHVPNHRPEVFALTRQLNHQAKYPELTYLWENTPQQRECLWTTTAICHQPVSLCISDRELRNLKNQTSPFLNQTVVTHAKQAVEGCAIGKIPSSYQPKNLVRTVANSDNLSEAISTKVKGDIKVTIDRVKTVQQKSQNLIQRLGNHNQSQPSSTNPNPANSRSVTNKVRLDRKINRQSDPEIASDFGFKSKSRDKPAQNDRNRDRDWF